jgi:hypothetical protein
VTFGFTFADLQYRDAPRETAFTNGAEFSGFARVNYLALNNPERRLTVATEAGTEIGRVSSLKDGFAKADAAIRANWQPGPVNVSSALRGGFGGGQIPFDQLSMMGMERDNSLWIRGHLGDYDGKKGNAPMGANYLLLQNDVMRKLYRNEFLYWEAGPFADTGRINGPYGSNGWMFDTGVESRLRVMHAATVVVIWGHDVVNGGNVFFTAIRPR